MSQEIRGDRDYSAIRSFCIDLNASNRGGLKPICTQQDFHECPECFGCEAGNRMLRYQRKAL